MAAILAKDNFICIFLNENDWIMIPISLNFIRWSPIANKPGLVQVRVWRRTFHWLLYAALGGDELNESFHKLPWFILWTRFVVPNNVVCFIFNAYMHEIRSAFRQQTFYIWDLSHYNLSISLFYGPEILNLSPDNLVSCDRLVAPLRANEEPGWKDLGYGFSIHPIRRLIARFREAS